MGIELRINVFDNALNGTKMASFELNRDSSLFSQFESIESKHGHSANYCNKTITVIKPIDLFASLDDVRDCSINDPILQYLYSVPPHWVINFEWM